MCGEWEMWHRERNIVCSDWVVLHLRADTVHIFRGWTQPSPAKLDGQLHVRDKPERSKFGSSASKTRKLCVIGSPVQLLNVSFCGFIYRYTKTKWTRYQTRCQDDTTLRLRSMEWKAYQRKTWRTMNETRIKKVKKRVSQWLNTIGFATLVNWIAELTAHTTRMQCWLIE